MIVIGYQGIGKSTISKKYDRCVDLDSNHFWVETFDGHERVRYSDWYKVYCKIAIHLSQQGYIVMVSSHKEVRDYLKETDEVVIACVPSLELKDEWIHKLKKRYDESKSVEDFKAYKNAESCYEENINDIISSEYPTIYLNGMDYVLADGIDSIVDFMDIDCHVC